MRVESRVFPPSIAKRVEGIFGYNILLYGFLFRRQWGSFSRNFARIGLLFIKCRRVQHKAAREDFFGSAHALGFMRCGVQAPIYTQKTRKNIYLCYVQPDFLTTNLTLYWVCLRALLHTSIRNSGLRKRSTALVL